MQKYLSLMDFLLYTKFVFIINGNVENIYKFSILEGYLQCPYFSTSISMCKKESQNQEEGFFIIILLGNL